MICKQKSEAETGFSGINRKICHVFSHAVWLGFIKSKSYTVTLLVSELLRVMKFVDTKGWVACFR